MKSSTLMYIESLAWLALAIMGSITGNDTASIVGFVAFTVNTVGSGLARRIENNKKENN